MQFGLLYEMQRPFKGTDIDWNTLYKETLEQYRAIRKYHPEMQFLHMPPGGDPYARAEFFGQFQARYGLDDE